ncbi:exosortase system-associated protein, TIGR04073 family [Geotalea sp. SG265]|uniref:exosortase system-associated protein, TIGR04073 family n=1 Tax=Geotalea sp. SG265 TaxID=2922867 RepID=UPI001FAF8286|nr:exosortase system-associated protein, TIGR04073 family [Geotalea sp. SG265]
MRIVVAGLPLLLLFVFTVPSFAQEAQQPEAIAEKMSFKLVRGLTNVVTGVVEIPKQSYLTVRDRGKIGYVVGPIKGGAMALYRTLLGAVETVFFMVPQPGYYDPMVNPEYVWQGWEKRPELVVIKETEPVEEGE